MTDRNRGFSLIEVVIVISMIALSLTIVGPRIGAGIGRLELEQAAQEVRSLITQGRLHAQRTDREHYLVIDKRENSITLLDSEMHPMRQQQLSSSIQIALKSFSDLESIFIAPSGIVRGEPIRLQNRAGGIEVALQ